MGCYRGTMSLKFACYVKTLGQDKVVFAFDTFEGFTETHPTGWPRAGDYGDDKTSEAELWKWAALLPIVPIRGDARKTAPMYLTRPLSFLWLDLDIDKFLGPTLNGIERLITSQTIIGLDDYGRPETPTVKPWADSVEAAGRWRKVAEYPEFIAFYQKVA